MGVVIRSLMKRVLLCSHNIYEIEHNLFFPFTQELICETFPFCCVIVWPLYQSKPNAQRGARTPHPEIKSLMHCHLSLLGEGCFFLFVWSDFYQPLQKKDTT